VSMAIFDLTPTHQGVALLRDMAMQPKVSSHFAVESNLVVFDSAQTKVYGVDSEFGDGLHRIAVLADGLVEEAAITVATRGTRALSFANNRLVAGPTLYNAPALTAAGTITGATDCWASRAGTGLLCFGNAPAQGRVLTADSGTLAVGASLLYAPSEANTPRRLVQGPSGQIAVSYVPVSGARSILLFTSAQLP